MLTARPTIYRGIQMRSRLEAHVARWLDTHPSFLPWEYEPTCFAGIAGQYLPDFVLHHRNFDSYIEVKSHTVREGELEDIMRPHARHLGIPAARTPRHPALGPATRSPHARDQPVPWPAAP